MIKQFQLSSHHVRFSFKSFQTVVHRLNFTKAAAELYITQPAVTKHIHELEHHFKVKLFERNGSRIKLTPAGESLRQQADQLFSFYQNLEFEMAGFSHDQKGKASCGLEIPVTAEY